VCARYRKGVLLTTRVNLAPPFVKRSAGNRRIDPARGDRCDD
jgi:hypothetical protein